ncbi:MnhB domain-containing protein [Marinactinospora thermotolerans]|uniref:Multicomponent Na+:H+ antiporter subunit B n=1 Tax=Marinactinospora thermotolerans DSM 45154 TaxID=1122192 RepID=A0A1T4SNA7_9ACTN|nr:MnhB domain-containing protein [Marinactinospora thermotolerans]SKA29398.1 multicomponent Na+:H+ antiporter subunit B [Marinactinospora thermotolerans DSM 45154]
MALEGSGAPRPRATAGGSSAGPPEGWEAPRERWLSTVVRPAFGPRSVLLEVAARLLIPAILTLSVFLLVSGHDRPGGGFAGGLVASMAYVLRYIAGGRHELAAGLPMRPNTLLALGMIVACGAAGVPLLFGRPILDTVKWEFTLPVFGDVKLLSALIFETGVFLIVVGLVLSVVAALGARMEAEEAEARQERAAEQARAARRRGGEKA